MNRKQIALGVAGLATFLVVGAVVIGALTGGGAGTPSATTGQDNHGHSERDIVGGVNNEKPDTREAAISIKPSEFDSSAEATPEQIGEAHSAMMQFVFTNLLNDSDFNAMLDDKSGTTSGDFGRALAEERIAAILDRQYIDGWRDSKVLSVNYEHFVDAAVTRWSNYEGGDSLVNTFQLDFVREFSRSADQLILDVGVTESYQGVKQDPNNGDTDSIERITYRLVDGRWRTSDWQPIQ